MVTRRNLMKAGGAMGPAALAPALITTSGARGDPVPGGTLDPTTIPKYAADLFVLPTMHWANPPGGVDGRDSRPVFTSTPDPYRGPMPFVTHLHGAHVTDESDGYPEAWYLPVARNIPAGYARVGSFYDQFSAEAHDR